MREEVTAEKKTGMRRKGLLLGVWGDGVKDKSVQGRMAILLGMGQWSR